MTSHMGPIPPVIRCGRDPGPTGRDRERGQGIAPQEGSMESQTRFVNVDLDVKSLGDLSPLLEAFGENVLRLHNARIGRRYWIRVELLRSIPRSPAEAIRGFCRLIEKLPPAAKKLWKNASSRQFDIGIQAGKKPTTSEWLLDVDMLRDVAKNRAQIELTVYSPVLKAGPIYPSSVRR